MKLHEEMLYSQDTTSLIFNMSENKCVEFSVHVQSNLSYKATAVKAQPVKKGHIVTTSGNFNL